MPAPEPGNFEELLDQGETIGAVLRTKYNVKPVYVSIGNKITLEDAIYWVMRCCRGYRLPEPIRFAHQAAGGNLKAAVNV
jgi:deoxyribonuclease V